MLIHNVPRTVMAKVHSFYSRTYEGLRVYHDDDQCPYGRRIKPTDRIIGTDARPKCRWCKEPSVDSDGRPRGSR
jgi:hypothetical protein